MNIPIYIKENDNILIIAPHPDDESIGVGGMLSLYSRQCSVIVMTDGRYGTKNNTPEVEIQVRKRQFENGMNYLGDVTYQLLEYEDGTLMQHDECMDQIDFSKYTKVFVSALNDNHVDHTAAFKYATNRIKEQNLRELEVYQYEVHVPLHDTSHYLDITQVIEKKKQLIKFHEDQLQYVDYVSIAYSLAMYRACQSNRKNRFFETYLKVDVFTDSIDINSFEREKLIQKYQLFNRVLVKWLGEKQKKIKLSDIIAKNGIKKIAIYGFSDMGRLLYTELFCSDIEVEYVIDKRLANNEELEVKICTPIEGNRRIDAVIVTAIYQFDEIKRELSDLGYRNIISLEEVVNHIR